MTRQNSSGTLKISLLGPVRVFLGPTLLSQSEFKVETARALLAYLALDPQAPHAREELAALLCPDQSDAAALRNLRQTLNRLRHAIADKNARPPFLEIARQTLQLNAASRCWLDVAEFREHLAAVKQHRHRHLIGCPLCLDHLRVAAELYRGDFMTGVTVDSLLFEEWVRIERERLHQQALEVLHLLAAHYEGVGEYENTLRYARRQLELESWYEEAQIGRAHV